MLLGPVPADVAPKADDDLVRVVAERWMRSVPSHRRWAENATTCQDFAEGRQFTEAEMEAMAKQGRPILQLNKIAPLVRLVSGYQRNNRYDITYLPGNDGASSEQTAEIISALVKAENSRNRIEFTDSQVFMDGITTGRGFWDYRLDFDNNDFGEMKITQADPFSVYVDPDCSTYDLNETAQFVNVSRWVSIDEIAGSYGKKPAEELKNRMSGSSYFNGYRGVDEEEDVGPIRNFAMSLADDTFLTGKDLYHTEFVDPYQKRIRLIDSQYAVSVPTRCFIDLETGDKVAIPENWSDEKIQKALLWGEAQNNPMTVAWRRMKRIRWTVICGDVLVHDDWSPYRTYSLVPYYGYFRRGFTNGMVTDLLDPQREINKRRISMTEILTRNANSGWMYHQNGLDPIQKENLKKHGAVPGIHIEWKGEDPNKAPKRIEPGGYPMGLERLEEHNKNDLREISGVNEATLGADDRVQSGRALEARQRQAVIALQVYLDNFQHSGVIKGEKSLELIQGYYTEQRIFRELGEDGSQVTRSINQKSVDPNDPGIAARINDVTVGKYQVVVDQSPMSATFKSAQFDEAMMVLEQLGPISQLLLQANPGLLIQMSSLPRKEEWIQALTQAVGAAQQQQAAAAGQQPQAPAPGGHPPTGI